MFTKFYEDIIVGTKSEFGSYAVTKEEIIEFARKYDPQPFHLDEELAKQSVFGALCASGWHTGSMMMAMLVENIKSQGIASMGSPGIDQLRWIKPVIAGDVLSVRQEVLEKRESASRSNIGLLKFRTDIVNNKDVTVATMIANMMILKRPS